VGLLFQAVLQLQQLGAAHAATRFFAVALAQVEQLADAPGVHAHRAVALEPGRALFEISGG